MTDIREMIIYCIGLTLELECIAFFYCAVLDLRYPKWILYIVYPLIFLLLTLPAPDLWRNSAFLRPFICVVISIGIVCLFSKNKLWEKVIFAVIPYFINIAASLFLIMLYGLITPGTMPALGHPSFITEAYLLISMFVIELIVILVLNRHKLRLSEKLIKYFAFFGCAQFIICHCALCTYFIDIEFIVYISAIGAYLLFTALFMFFIIRTTLKIAAEQQHQKHIEDQYTHLCDQYTFLQENYLTYRKLRHDLKDHIIVIAGLAERNETEELDKYSKSLLSSWDSLSAKTFCDSAAIDIIISEKYNIAVNSGIDMSVTTQSLKGCGIDDIYLCTVFSNILRNALEAAQHCSGKPYIRLASYIKMGSLVIVCKNSMPEDIVKKDPEKHGFGLKILNEIADILGGNFMTVKTNNEFTATFNAPVNSEVTV